MPNGCLVAWLRTPTTAHPGCVVACTQLDRRGGRSLPAVARDGRPSTLADGRRQTRSQLSYKARRSTEPARYLSMPVPTWSPATAVPAASLLNTGHAPVRRPLPVGTKRSELMEDDWPRDWRCTCGATRHATLRDRCARGHTDMKALGQRTQFEPGELQAIQHGLRSERTELPPEFAHLATDIDSFIAGCLVDEGDAADVPTRRRSLLNYRARLHRRILQIDAAIELRGLFDKRGKLRLAWLGQLQSLIGAARSLDQLLGLERRQKPVNPLDAVRAAVEAARQEAQG